MFWKGNIDRGRNETPDNPRRCAPFGAASAFAEAMEGLGKNIVRTENRLKQPASEYPKKEKRPFPFEKGRTFSFSEHKTNGRSTENTVDTDKKVQ